MPHEEHQPEDPSAIAIFVYFLLISQTLYSLHFPYFPPSLLSLAPSPSLLHQVLTTKENVSLIERTALRIVAQLDPPRHLQVLGPLGVFHETAQ